MFGVGSGRDSKAKAKQEAKNVSLQKGQLPVGYDPDLLRKSLLDIGKRAPIKADKYNYNYTKVVEQFQKGNVQQCIADAQTVLKESRRADFYRELGNCALSITNCNWSSQEGSNAQEIISPIAMICYAAAHEDPYMFPSLITAANQLYILKGEEFKEKMHTDPFSLFHKSFADKIYKTVPLKEAMLYAQAILESYGFKLDLPDHLIDRASEMEKEEIEKQRSTMRQKSDSYPTIAADVPLPSPDQMSVMGTSMANHGQTINVPASNAVSLDALRNGYTNTNNSDNNELKAIYVDEEDEEESNQANPSVLDIHDLMANIRQTSSRL